MEWGVLGLYVFREKLVYRPLSSAMSCTCICIYEKVSPQTHTPIPHSYHTHHSDTSRYFTLSWTPRSTESFTLIAPTLPWRVKDFTLSSALPNDEERFEGSVECSRDVELGTTLYDCSFETFGIVLSIIFSNSSFLLLLRELNFADRHTTWIGVSPMAFLEKGSLPRLRNSSTRPFISQWTAQWRGVSRFGLLLICAFGLNRSCNAMFSDHIAFASSALPSTSSALNLDSIPPIVYSLAALPSSPDFHQWRYALSQQSGRVGNRGCVNRRRGHSCIITIHDSLGAFLIRHRPHSWTTKSHQIRA